MMNTVLDQATEKKRSILVVDDEPFVGDALKLIFESSGYEVVLVAKGRAGIKQACSRGFSIAIIDLFLPDISGLQTIEKIHKQKPEIPIILITGQGTPWAFAEAIRLGVVGVLSKPFRPADILQLVTRAVAR
jgi:DNA-binding NtrC family response regulator